ncbi:uncharacterized protein TOT_010001171 [Theileria orientalis strain Shintoku]|uniref:Uncharacterized protein n=1 Tax=Theileria orientalis strain Shintoku TaxID=869250 RepID=J4CCN8_THEOR|nr:uncharacterized protein TOT_010001171 [Theileria orientalis strain Shintoku]BAM39717.1 uncharacterized protein TOT_010001171 [Theileria orientalis strain Shintoku]|eukprot:XP_009690018.1 uncharacterized protein TOT_010001171 [Theileria orientalis strain Shintoku]
MKVDTICTYILVYLLTCVRFNVLVKVNAVASQPAETSSDSHSTSLPEKEGIVLNINTDTKSNKKLEYKEVGQYVTYNPKENKVFNLVKDDNIQLWKATDPSEYCEKVEVDLMNNDAKAVTVCLGNDENKVFMKTGKNKIWNEFDISKVTRSAININYLHETYFYTNELQAHTRTFTAKKGFGFKGAHEFIKEKKVTIWTTNNKSEYAYKIVNEGGNKVIIHIGKGTSASTKVFNKVTEGSWTEEISEVEAESTLPTPQDGVTNTHPKVKLLKADPYNSSKILELDEEEYMWTSNANVAIYQIEESVNCVKLMIDDAILWVYDSKFHGGIYPRSLEYHAVTGTIILRFEYHYIIYENTDDGWISTESGSLEVKFYVADPDDPNNTVELPRKNITREDMGYITQFHIDIDVKCVKITYGPFLLWQHDSNKLRGKYPRIVYFNDTTESFVLEFENLDIKYTKNDQGGWDYTETDTSKTKRAIVQRVELDIQNTESTNTYHCIVEEGFAKFMPKHGNRFTLVKGKTSIFSKAHTLIWESKGPTDLATMVVRDGAGTWKPMNNVTIFFGKNHKHFTKSENKFDIDSDIRLYDNEPYEESNELSDTQYTEDHSDDIFRYKFNDDTKCTEVKSVHRSIEDIESTEVEDEEVLVWQHDKSKHGDQYPKDLKYYWPDKMSINFEHAFIVHSKNEEAKWDEGHLFDFKLYVKDTNNLKELDATAYELTQDNQEFLFTFKDEVKLEEVKHKGKELWKHDSDKHGDKYPKLLKYATDKLALSFDDTFVVYTKNVDGKLANGILFEFKLYVKDSHNELKEMGVTAYDLINQDNEHVFKFKDEHKCEMVKHMGYEVWKQDHSKNYSKYPQSVYYNKTTGTFVLRFDGLDKTFAKNDQGKWECTETETTDGGAKFTLPTSQDNVTTTQPKVKLLKVNPSDPDSFMELDANEYKSTTRGSVVLYKISSGVNCVQLIFDDVLLWVYDPSQYGGRYPRSVYHNTVTESLLLRFRGLHITFEKNEQGQWLFTESGPLAVKFHVVDPDNPNNTFELSNSHYTVTESGDITTFNIADNVDTIALTYGSVLLWQHDSNKHSGKYPKLLYFIKSTDTLLLRFEGLDIAYAKNIEGVWEYTETDTSDSEATTTQPESDGTSEPGEGASTTPPPESSGESFLATPSAQTGSSTTQPRVRLLKHNPSNPDSLIELGANDFSFSTSGSVVLYKISSGVNCVQLIFDDVLLWVYDPSQYGGRYPRSVYHNTVTESLLLRFRGLHITFEKNEQGQWLFTESGPLAVKFHVVDPDNPNNTFELSNSHYTVTESGDITTFNIADNVDTIALTYGSVLLWQHDSNKHSGKYPKLLYFIKSTDTLLLRFEGLDIAYAKNIEGVWEYTETDTSGIVSDTVSESGYSSISEDERSFTIGESYGIQSVEGVPRRLSHLRSSSAQVKLLKVNPSDPSGRMELSANEYKSITRGNVTLYQILKSVKCVQLIVDDVLLWEHDSNQRFGKYPRLLYHDTITDGLVLRFEGIDIAFEKTAEGQWIFTESGPLAVKFHLADNKDPNSTVELDSTQFTVDDNRDITTFNIADHVNPIALTYGQVLLWQHDLEQHGDVYPNSSYYNKNTDTLVVKF